MKKYFMVLLICAALLISFFTFEAAASTGIGQCSLQNCIQLGNAELDRLRDMVLSPTELKVICPQHNP